ncbi:LPXTG-motif cell wall anchor domain-containing protein [Pilibacter termitis]|uniref:LPXTG-motif cell wall anchor domain-containing protein n=1 Tax=Pilibacter termitis TaxID=263852 RepID=A0A1T4KC84_9ENTE|nr:LPXTG cell wall anchor domain-containing protein [Pilibacter termitis]SJZ40040.1 LPXTG-motif cell wall anchor domain-containing protein [Pilibacter termitis]
MKKICHVIKSVLFLALLVLPMLSTTPIQAQTRGTVILRDALPGTFDEEPTIAKPTTPTAKTPTVTPEAPLPATGEVIGMWISIVGVGLIVVVLLLWKKKKRGTTVEGEWKV